MSTNAEFEAVDDEDMDMEGYNMDGMDDMDDMMDSAPLLWSMKLEPNKPVTIEEPPIPGYIVHITNACFGISVKNNSRTIIMCNPSTDENDKSLETPLCVLREKIHENHTLDLLFNEAATLSLKGKNVSTVHLTGYVQPPVESLDPDLEDMDNEELMAALRAQKDQDMVPQLMDENEEDNDDDDDDDDNDNNNISPPPQKRQKTSSGSKSTKKQNSNQSQKRKSPQSKPKPTPSISISNKDKDKDDDNKEDTAPNTLLSKNKKDNKKNKKNKKNKMQNMKGGIKYRDMKTGDGDFIQNGQKIKVFYVGQTNDKKVFDKSLNGAGFEFIFGAGDVIKGWDMGLKGMKVGGKRKLIIPSKLGYGSNGKPPKIPPNAELTFTVEVKAAN